MLRGFRRGSYSFRRCHTTPQPGGAVPTARLPHAATTLLDARAKPESRCVVLVRDFLPVRMMRRCRGCRGYTVKRVKTAWLGNAAVMVHYLRIVNSRGGQWAHGYHE
jgi:hypothetical protein